MHSNVMRGIRFARRVFNKSAPYLLLEILLPGGTLVAFAVFLYQNRDAGTVRRYRRLAAAAVMRLRRWTNKTAVAAYSSSGVPALLSCGRALV